MCNTSLTLRNTIQHLVYCHAPRVGALQRQLDVFWTKSYALLLFAVGTPQEIEQEVARLQLLLEGLKGMSAQLKMNSAEAHPRDKNASYLWKILFWRKQREQAVTREINRLKATLKR